MYDLTSAVCPVCGKQLSKDDDIVVCPECGTPHHRSCWFANGGCFNEQKHAEGFIWESPRQAKKAEEKALPPGTVVCPYCHTLNPDGNRFCDNCGEQLPVYVDRDEEEDAGEDGGISERDRKLLENVKIEGLPVSDYLTYLGKGALPHVLTFIKQEQSASAVGFNFTAALSPLLFFTYYRLWGLGAIAGLITALLNLPSCVNGILQVNSDFLGLSLPVWNRLSEIGSIITIAFSLACAVFGSYVLRKGVAAKLRRIRARVPEQEAYEKELARRSCPSRIYIGALLLMLAGCIYFMFFGMEW